MQSAAAEGADYRNRIWDPHEELPFAGHPSLGTAVAVARWRGLDEASFVQETGAGLQPVEVRKRGRALARLDAPERAGARAGARARRRRWRRRACGAEDAHPELPPQVVSTGMPT